MNEFLPFLADLVNGVLSGWRYLLPEIALTFTFLIVILADLFFAGRDSKPAFWLVLVGILASAVLSYMQLALPEGNFFHGSIRVDRLGVSFKLIFAFATLLFALFIRNSKIIQTHRKGVGDLYMLLPATLLGLNLMAMSSTLLMIFISIEMVSIGSYLMVGYVSGEKKQTEAAMKYALFGSTCSAVMLYGMSLLYGFTGTIDISNGIFISHLSRIPESAAAMAVILTLAGIGFKLSFAPLHFWSPDVYEGAPTAVTAFLSTAPKIAGFAVLIRFMQPFYAYQAIAGGEIFNFESTVSAIAVLTMLVGNFAALWQNNIKRMLAYSSIGHTGFALMAIVAFSQNSFKSLIFYFTIYTLMNMAAFMLAGELEDRTGKTDMRHYKGLGRYFKLEMACFVIVLISLTGLPPTAGFIAKLFIFSATFEKYMTNGSTWLIVLLITGAITTVVSLFYYLKVPLNAYLRHPEEELTLLSQRSAVVYLVIVLTILILLFGLFPSLLG